MVVENSSDVIEGLLALGKQRKSFSISNNKDGSERNRVYKCIRSGR